MRPMKRPQPEMDGDTVASIYIELLSYLTRAAYRMGSNGRSLVDGERRDLAHREVLTISATLASFPLA